MPAAACKAAADLRIIPVQTADDHIQARGLLVPVIRAGKTGGHRVMRVHIHDVQVPFRIWLCTEIRLNAHRIVSVEGFGGIAMGSIHFTRAKQVLRKVVFFA